MDLQVCGFVLWQRTGRSIFNEEAASAPYIYILFFPAFGYSWTQIKPCLQSEGVLELGPSVSYCPSLQNGSVQQLMLIHILLPPFMQHIRKHFRETFVISVELHGLSLPTGPHNTVFQDRIRVLEGIKHF